MSEDDAPDTPPDEPAPGDETEAGYESPDANEPDAYGEAGYEDQHHQGAYDHGYEDDPFDDLDVVEEDVMAASIPEPRFTYEDYVAAEEESDKPKPKLKKRRTLAIVIPLLVLGIISTVFGMMMAVASDLPSLEQLPQTEHSENSELYDIRGRKLGTLASNEGRIIVSDADIGANIKYAVIATEDERFYENSGVDVQGIGRAFFQDVVKGGAVQGGSTITQQFVKVATQNQNKRTVFNKLRESALAYHLTRKWTKDKILTEYLNSIYFGNGAYGVESAARTYFGKAHPDCGDGPDSETTAATAGTTSGDSEDFRPCSRVLVPGEAAMLAAIIASPSAYDPVAHPQAATDRRDMVLQKMKEQGRISEAEYNEALTVPVPSKDDITTPEQDSKEPYFTSWVRQSLVDNVGPQQAFEGGLKVRTTIDLDLQQAARDAIGSNLYRADGSGPTASLVAIDNETGEVRAMIGGKDERNRLTPVKDDYRDAPFNLATQGERQPGSAFKPFILATALKRGIGPGSVWPSRKRYFKVPGGKDKFEVNNFDDAYYGRSTLANALTRSDNAVFSAVGLDKRVGTKRVAKTANAMGIRTPISTNPAMTLGGLKEGVTPLDMAHAYETFAENGQRVWGTLGAGNEGPVGIRRIEKLGSEKLVEKNKRRTTRALPAKAAETAKNLMLGPVRFGTAKRAQISGQVIRGKTGTTENNGDAWFVGYTDKWTVAVWVGYPDSVKSMNMDYFGDEVTGGTFPAVIWRQFMLRALTLDKARANEAKRRRAGERAKKKGKTTSTGTGAAPVTPVTPPASTTSGAGTTKRQPTTPVTPTTPAPATPTPAPTGAGTPTTGGTGGTGAD